ncbi:hypothetical protein AYJ10_18845 [Serratia marcescens]|nr:hypothetical protein AYJ10_18845 [Serratia marcescens]
MRINIITVTLTCLVQMIWMRLFLTTSSSMRAVLLICIWTRQGMSRSVSVLCYQMYKLLRLCLLFLQVIHPHHNKLKLSIIAWSLLVQVIQHNIINRGLQWGFLLILSVALLNLT